MEDLSLSCWDSALQRWHLQSFNDLAIQGAHLSRHILFLRILFFCLMFFLGGYTPVNSQRYGKSTILMVSIRKDVVFFRCCVSLQDGVPGTVCWCGDGWWLIRPWGGSNFRGWQLESLKTCLKGPGHPSNSQEGDHENYEIQDWHHKPSGKMHYHLHVYIK